MTPETQTKKKLKAHLLAQMKASPGLWFTSLSQRFQSGLPDFMVVEAGKVAFIEAKASNNMLRPLQAHVCEKLMQAGAAVYVAYLKNNRLCFEAVTSTHIELCKGKIHGRKHNTGGTKRKLSEGEDRSVSSNGESA